LLLRHPDDIRGGINASFTRRKFLAVAAASTAVIAVSAATALATVPGHDGKVAFNRGGDIYTINLDGSGLKRLTSNGGGNGWPKWSPDGTKITWCTTARCGS
jgi:hypothetical protein